MPLPLLPPTNIPESIIRLTYSLYLKFGQGFPHIFTFSKPAWRHIVLTIFYIDQPCHLLHSFPDFCPRLALASLHFTAMTLNTCIPQSILCFDAASILSCSFRHTLFLRLNFSVLWRFSASLGDCPCQTDWSYRLVSPSQSPYVTNGSLITIASSHD